MARITSSQGRQPTTFRASGPHASFSLSLSDTSPDASWRLRIEVETADGGRFCLGAIDTIPSNASLIKIPNRVVAVCSLAGAIQWEIFPTLNFGTPKTGETSVTAELKFGSAEDFSAGCCPLVAIPGFSIDINKIISQTPTGPPPSGSPRLTLFSGTGFMLSATVAHVGAHALEFVQVHDAAAADAISSATMLGIGVPIDAGARQTLLIDHASRPLRFLRGFTLALSTSQNTFVLSTDTIAANGQWSITENG